MEQKDYRLAAIMYTDIVGFSRMMERDEAGTLELLSYHNELIGGIVASHRGTVIKTIGDALLVDFKNTVEALQSALEIQDRLYARNKENPGFPLLVRIGLHLGDIYFYENDALGEGINIAARLQSQARPGCICFSQDVYNLVLNKIEFRAEKLGKVSLKNITKEIHAYEITTPNVEFDPEGGKPRPGYEPGSFLDETARQDVRTTAGTAAGSEPRSPAAAQPAPAEAAPARRPTAAEPERDYGPEGSKGVLADIRRAILSDTKAMGRRMSVDEALSRYGRYGVEASEVIATMADQGILARESRPARGSVPPDPPRPPEAGFGGSGDRPFPAFDSGSFGRNIEAAVHGIVSEIERSVERSVERSRERGGVDSLYVGRADEAADRIARHIARHRRREERHAMRDAIRREVSGGDTGKWDKKLMEDENWKPGEEELSRDFAAYREGLASRSAKIHAGLVGNVASFLGVNAFLWYLNLQHSRGFLWAAIVSAAWGIGVVSSFVAAGRSGAKVREADAMPDLDPGQLDVYKKLNRTRDSIAQHGASTFTVPFLLALVNYITDPSFLWFLIPTAALLLGFFSHLAAYSASKRRLQRRLLESLGIAGGWREIFRRGRTRRETTDGLGPYADLYREAESARNAIADRLASGSAGPVDADLVPSLDQYLGQVRLLAQSANEIDRIVEAIPMADLSKDKAALVAKREAASSDSLKAEYDASIEEIAKQERSYGSLAEQSEVLRLRLGSSVNQLKQMRLDMARLQAAPGAEAATSIESIRKRSDELARYLEDLRSGYDESRLDPFAELERLERAAAEEGKLDPGAAAGGKQDS